MTPEAMARQVVAKPEPEDERSKQMPIFRMLGTILLWPGDAVRRWLGLTVEQDGGLIRSFVNQAFWGTVAVVVALRYFI